MFWTMAEDKFSISRAITSLALSRLCQEDVFAPMSQRTRTRVVNLSSSTRSDYLCLALGNDL